MIKRILIIAGLAFFAFGLFPLLVISTDASTLAPAAQHYIDSGAAELGAANLVTAVVVSYRGLDTLGEVSVLFTATAGVALVLKSLVHGKTLNRAERRKGSELLQTGAQLLFPILVMFGIYVFVNGHLSPGGGFQGGVIIASAVVLLITSESERTLREKTLHLVEALSGFAYVAVGLAGLWLAAGFLDPRFLPAGEFGNLMSAGAIPVIYSLIGLKVGSELSGVIDSLRRKRSTS
jgi:multicomponent Na+:H+ antiporter subunit B